MMTVLIVVHLMIALALVGVILLQRSEGGALGIGGGAGGGLMTGRAAGNLLTRTTAILAAGFFATSLILALMANHRDQPRSIMDAPVTPAQEAPKAPEAPAQPSVPLGK